MIAWLKRLLGNLLIDRIRNWMNPKAPESPNAPPPKKPIDPSDPFAGS